MKSVGIAELKSRLSEYLRAVRRGRTIIVTDRDTPVARLVPLAPERGRLKSRPALRPLASVRDELPLPPPPARRVDPLAALLEDRSAR